MIWTCDSCGKKVSIVRTWYGRSEIFACAECLNLDTDQTVAIANDPFIPLLILKKGDAISQKVRKALAEHRD